ncbi:MAG: hypothetical protein H0V82_10640 [Candidatus Protochlamydia sp.]|nr:hypothetical protein [Candidatus Protochlamydia sp.]
MIRTKYLGVDEAFCALQGYGCASLVNFFTSPSINPMHAAIGCAGFSYLEKVIRQFTQRFFMSQATFNGPLPTNKVTILSYGFATYTTFKAMELTGLILQVPTAVKIIGLACTAALILKAAVNLSQVMQNVVDYTSRPQNAENRRLDNQNLLNDRVGYTL